MAKATEEKAQIQLASTFKKPVELTYHPHTLRAEPGKPVTVTETEARFWIGTGKFDRVGPEPERELSPLEELMKKTRPELVEIAAEKGITAGNLKKEELAVLILQNTEEK